MPNPAIMKWAFHISSSRLPRILSFESSMSVSIKNLGSLSETLTLRNNEDIEDILPGSGSGFSSFGELVAGPWGEPGFGRAFMEDDELAGIQCLEFPRRAAGPSNFEIYSMRSADAEVQAWIIGGVKAGLT